MNLLLLGGFFLKKNLESLGHKSVICGQNESFDINIDLNRTHILDLLRQIPRGHDFDFVVLVENIGERVFPKGIEESPIPTVFYSIDTHLNLYWHREYGRAFDLVLTTQKDYVEKFKKSGAKRAFWLPWSIDPNVFHDHGLKRIYDIVFIGTLDPSSRRKRSYLVEELSKKFNVKVFGTQPDKRLSPTEMARVYSQAKIVLNESILEELNFRVFEAMACGPLLMTEKIGNGLLDLFQDRRHLVVYDHKNVIDLAAYYLRNSKERDTIARTGKGIVTEKHSHIARTRALVKILQSQVRPQGMKRNRVARRSLGGAYYLAGLRFWPQKNELLKRAEICLRKAIQIDGEDWASYLYLGMVHANRGNWKKAEENYLVSISKRPDFFHAHVLLGNVYVPQGKTTGAKQEYLIAAECTPGLSKSLRQRLERAATEDIQGAKLCFYLGRIYEKQGMPLDPGFLKNHVDPAPGSAAEYYAKSIKIDPTYSAPWLALGNVYFRHRLYDTAIPIYEQVVQILPQKANVHHRLGLCYQYCYKRKEGWRNLFKSYHLSPRNGKKSSPEQWELSAEEKSLALLELGHSLYDMNRFDEARKHYRKALEYDPQNAEIYAYLGIAHLQLGQIPLARWNLEKSLNLDPMNTHIRELLSEIRLKDTACSGQ